MGSRSFNIGTLRLLCGLVDMDSVDDMCDETRRCGWTIAFPWSSWNGFKKI